MSKRRRIEITTVRRRVTVIVRDKSELGFIEQPYGNGSRNFLVARSGPHFFHRFWVFLKDSFGMH